MGSSLGLGRFEGTLSCFFRRSPLFSVRPMCLFCSAFSCVGVAEFSLVTLWARRSYSLLAGLLGLLGPVPFSSRFFALVFAPSIFLPFPCPFSRSAAHFPSAFLSTPP